jgi:DoxX
MKTTSYTQRRSPIWRDLPIDLISRSSIARWAPVPLRLIVGYGFMEHGFAKLARGLDAFPAILQAIGVPAPHFMGWLTIFVEIVGGLAVLLGALIPAGQHTDGGGSAGCHLHRASALRVQFDQAPGGDGCRRAVRAARLRNRSPLPRLSCGPRPGGIRTIGDRWPSRKAQRNRASFDANWTRLT